jgi:acyl-CoA thioesterase-1
MMFAWALPVDAATPTILVVGDSLSAGYGIKVQEGWVNLLSQRLSTQGYDYRVVNASVSGETSSGARTRFASLVNTHHPGIVILEIGANDGLRGLPTNQMRDNIANMISTAQSKGSSVLLVGIQMPPNYGDAYTTAFTDVYLQLSKLPKVRFVPFFLKDVALNDKFMQADNIHPNEQGQPYLLNTVWPELKPLLAKKR